MDQNNYFITSLTFSAIPFRENHLIHHNIMNINPIFG